MKDWNINVNVFTDIGNNMNVCYKFVNFKINKKHKIKSDNFNIKWDNWNIKDFLSL